MPSRAAAGCARPAARCALPAGRWLLAGYFTMSCCSVFWALKRSESFTYMSNPRLRNALELKLFEDCRDTFKITAGSSSV